MASRLLYLILVSFIFTKVESASLIERSYEYVLSLGKNLAPNLMDILDCLGENDAWLCAKERAGKFLEKWEAEVDKQRRDWQEAADAEVASSGRALEEMPSKLGREVENSLFSVADMVQQGVARAQTRKHHDDSGGIDSITISTGSDKKKMKKKKKQKPPKIHLVHPVMMTMNTKNQEEDRGFNGRVQSWVIGEVRNTNGSQVGGSGGRRSGGRKGRGLMTDLWEMGEKAVDAVAEHALEKDILENDVEDKSSSQEQRGKKKKKKKAILKLLILGAVLKAKIATLLQILSFKLQVKFFIIALIGLGINLARFWLDVKKSHQPPQKVIYYEHAQHQHHYDHEEEPGWGPWSRSMDPNEETDIEIDLDVQNKSPYRGHVDRHAQTYIRPLLTRV